MGERGTGRMPFSLDSFRQAAAIGTRRRSRPLSPGDRIWVLVPHHGYVGVGRVTGAPVQAKDFFVDDGGVRRPIFEAGHAEYQRQVVNDEDRAEFFVPVKWIRPAPSHKQLTRWACSETRTRSAARGPRNGIIPLIGSELSSRWPQRPEMLIRLMPGYDRTRSRPLPHRSRFTHE